LGKVLIGNLNLGNYGSNTHIHLCTWPVWNLKIITWVWIGQKSIHKKTTCINEPIK
jgi:hypothetical protein